MSKDIKMAAGIKMDISVAGVQGFFTSINRKYKGYSGPTAKFRTSVGYTAYYAVYVHENLQTYHRIGQAKFLEQAFREMSRWINPTIVGLMRTGVSLPKAVRFVCERILARSRQLVPIDTGFLYRSGFWRVDEI